jgi:MarR family transcriptional regulator, organic hydroperoxide resistance regulator
MKNTTPETTFNLLAQVTELWQAEVKVKLNEYNLTLLEYTVLSSIVHLTKESTEMTQTKVSSHTQIKAMNTSIIMRKLQTKKLIQRKEHPVDTRAKTISLTPIGEKKITDVVQAVEALTVSFFKIEPSKKYWTYATTKKNKLFCINNSTKARIGCYSCFCGIIYVGLICCCTS